MSVHHPYFWSKPQAFFLFKKIMLLDYCTTTGLSITTYLQRSKRGQPLIATTVVVVRIYFYGKAVLKYLNIAPI